MGTLITLCRGIGEETSTDCVDIEGVVNAAVLAPCRVEMDTCIRTTGDALRAANRSLADESETAGDCLAGIRPAEKLSFQILLS